MSNKIQVFLVLSVLICMVSYSHEAGLKSRRVLRRSKRSGSSQDYLSAASDLDTRINHVLGQIYELMPVAAISVNQDISRSNREKAILGLANLLGSVFGIASASGGNVQFGQLSKGEQILVTAQALYGYGYWGPFLLDFEDPKVRCGIPDFQAALSEYSFLTDMETNYGYLNSYAGSNPRSQLNDVNDPTILSYYAVEFDHAIRRNLYCILSKKGTTENALYLNTLIDLYIQLINERLSMTEEAIDEMEGDYNSNRI